MPSTSATSMATSVATSTATTHAAPPPADHRVRTGASRREATRQKLLGTALRGFAEKGLDAPLIDDFIAAAGISRGTFYNYFNTTGELLDAVTAELSDEVIASIEAHVIQLDDPVHRLVSGCLLYMQIAVQHPAWGGFVVQAAARHPASGPLMDVYLPRDLMLAKEAGRISFATLRAARDVLVGSLHQAIESVLRGVAPPDHLTEVMQMALRALGLDARCISKIGLDDLPALALPPGIQSLEAASRRLPR